jgi:transcription elongation factor Elf1
VQFLENEGKLFVCPECGEQNLSIHRKTYENVIIVFCSSCRLISSFEPSKEAYYDLNNAWEEFTSNYKLGSAHAQISAITK